MAAHGGVGDDHLRIEGIRDLQMTTHPHPPLTETITTR